MPISDLYVIGTAAGNGVASVTVTPGVNVPAGSLIVVCTDSYNAGSSYGPSSVTDTKSNSYQLLYGSWSPYPNPSMFVCGNCNALTTSDTITVTWAASGQLNAIVLGCAGAALTNFWDQIAANSSSDAVMSIVTGQLAMSGELAVAYWVSKSAQGPPTVAAGWTSAAAFQGAANTHWVNAAWQTGDGPGPVTATATTPSPGTGWSGTLVTFRPVIHPTATLAAGGSAQAVPVSTVTGAATLACGTSIAEPADLAPPAAPSVPVFPAGYTPAVADFTAWIGDAFQAMTGRAVLRAEASASQSLAASTWTALALSALEDPYGGWSAAGNASQPANSWLAPWTGWWRVTVRWASAAQAAWCDAAVSVSGAAAPASPGGTLCPSGQSGGAGASVIVPMIGGRDYVQALAWTSAAGSTEAAAGLHACMEILPVAVELTAAAA